MTLAAGDAALARAGGGGSFGSRGMRTFSAPPTTRTAPGASPFDRTMTQPTRPNAAGPANPGFSRPGGLFGGFGGGLLAGFLGAGLLGMLFGHGFMGGLGGAASLFGLLLQIGLIVLVGRFLWRMWQSRSEQPAMAGSRHEFGRGDGMGGNGPGGMPLGGGLGSGLGSGAPSGRSDEVGIGPADYDSFEKLLGDLQSAYGAEDLGKLRSVATPEMVSYFSEELAQNASRGVINQVSEVKLEQGDLAEAWREGDTDYATVAMRYSLVDRMVDRASGRVVSGGDGRDMVTEVWTFRRSRGSPWMVSAIQQAA